jgi:hypothetical protein
LRALLKARRQEAMRIGFFGAALEFDGSCTWSRRAVTASWSNATWFVGHETRTIACLVWDNVDLRKIGLGTAIGKCWSRSLRRAAWAITVLLATGATPVLADDGPRLSGFGTFGYVRDNRGDIAPARDISQLPKDGFRTGAGWLVDTRIGVQVEYAFSPLIDLVGQFVLRDQFKGDFDSSTDLAYVAFKPSPQWAIRAGRISYDAFLMADHRNVGYAYQWVRPPAEFYGWIPIFSLDGIDAAYTFGEDDVQWRFKVQAGRSENNLPIQTGFNHHAKDMLGASLSRQSGPWRLKAAYAQFTSTRDAPAFAALQGGLDQVIAANLALVSAEAAELRKNISFRNARISYTTLGAAYDDGTWLGQAELGRSTATADVIPHGTMAYLSIGRRFGPWTPALTRSASRPDKAYRPAANNWGAFNASVRDPAIFVLNSTRIEQDTTSLSLRWDFRSDAALKLQWDRTVIKPSGYGLWWRDTAINLTTQRINQLSASLDFVF